MATGTQHIPARPLRRHNGGVDNPIQVFDRAALRRHKARAAASLPAADFLIREAGNRLIERLDAVRRTFPAALDLGCQTGALAPQLAGKVGQLIQADASEALARRAGRENGISTVVADEDLLPFAPARFDLVISCLALQWTNDLPGALRQMRTILKPGGLFLASMIGGNSLHELREAWIEAELELEGGAGPRVSPFVELRDAAGLLQRAGFALPVADVDTITVDYADPSRLMADLRAMGETNAATARRRNFTRRATLDRVSEIYRARHGDGAGRVPATFDIVTMTAWTPASGSPDTP